MQYNVQICECVNLQMEGIVNLICTFSHLHISTFFKNDYNEKVNY